MRALVERSEFDLFDTKRITLLAGHYGSGKTNIAVNWAKYLRDEGKRVSVADLDIVNPYFRTKDSAADFEEWGIKLISSPYANSNVDLPSLPKELYSVVDDKSFYSVIDVGGDDRGAYALGRFVPKILEENNYELLLVINKYRPLTPDSTTTLEIMKEIEAACRMKFTAIVNNSNLGRDTTAQTVLDSVGYAEEVSRESGLPIKMTTAEKRLCGELKDKIDNLFCLTLQSKLI